MILVWQKKQLYKLLKSLDKTILVIDIGLVNKISIVPKLNSSEKIFIHNADTNKINRRGDKKQ